MLCTYEKDTTKHEEVEKKLVVRDEVLSRVKKELKKAQESMKQYYDSDRREVSFEIRDYVYLNLKPYKYKKMRKTAYEVVLTLLTICMCQEIHISCFFLGLFFF